MVWIALTLILVLVCWWFFRQVMTIPTKKLLFAEGRETLSLRALHRYIYCRWPKHYIKYFSALLVGLRGRKWFARTYHSKVLTPQLAKSIINIKQSVPLQDLEQIIPYPVARQIVLSHPLDIVIFECPCRAGKKNPCQPSQVCMVIGQPFTDFILAHHSLTARRITTEEAEALLEQVHRQGCVHTAWFKDACLERFYVICNCCKCCCGGINAMKYGMSMIAPSGYRAELDPEKCRNCGICQKVCPFTAIDESLQIDTGKCMGCGVCVSKCQFAALTLVRDENKGIPLDVVNL